MYNFINPLWKLHGLPWNYMVCHETYYIIKHCAKNACSHSSKSQSTPTTLLIHCGNYMVCHETYYIIKHCAKNTCSHSSKSQSTPTSSCPPFTPTSSCPPFTPTSSCLPFTPKHSAVLHQPPRPRILISTHCVFLSLGSMFVIFFSLLFFNSLPSRQLIYQTETNKQTNTTKSNCDENAKHTEYVKTN